MSAPRLIPLRWFLSLATVASLAMTPTPSAAQATGFRLEGLRTEWATNPIGIDEPAPRLTWTLHAERRGTERAPSSRAQSRDLHLSSPATTSKS